MFLAIAVAFTLLSVPSQRKLEYLEVPKGSKYLAAYAVSDDGRVAVGSVGSGSWDNSTEVWMHRPVVWIDGVPTAPVLPQPQISEARFCGVSPNGRYAVGWTANSMSLGVVIYSDVEFFVWSQKSGVVTVPIAEQLEARPTSVGREPQVSVSNDGRVVGWADFPDADRNVRIIKGFSWRQGLPLKYSVYASEPDVETMPDGSRRQIMARSENERYRAGQLLNENHPKCIWDAKGKLTLVPDPAGNLWPISVTNDGNKMTANGSGWAYLWTKHQGTRRLDDVLQGFGISDYQSWRESSAGAMSSNGRFLVGTAGYNDFTTPPCAFVLDVR